MDYNVPGGKLNQGLSVVDSVAILKGRELTVGVLQGSRPRLVRRMGPSLLPPATARPNTFPSSSKHIYSFRTTLWTGVSLVVASPVGTA